MVLQQALHSQMQCTIGVQRLGVQSLGRVHCNLSVPQLVECSIRRQEGQLAENGALCVETGKYTGRSPQDRFIVDEAHSHDRVNWNRDNRPISEAAFDRLYQKVLDYLQGRDLFVFEGYVGADPAHRFGVRVINELAWQNLFAHQLFRRPEPEDLTHYQADFTVIAVPNLLGDPAADDLHSEAFVLLHLSRGIVLIGGTHYAGEIKKSVFSLLNYHLPLRGVLPMHCAANLDADNRTALFFGLSGTGKTTLSADADHRLIGDDEHGWSKSGIFNFEGGCYAKTIRLSAQHEPQIWSALRFGALLENVALDPDMRTIDYDDSRLTENTRAAYPLHHLANWEPTGTGANPATIFFLTADAFGVLPPIARLTRSQAMYHFLSGYTSKLAGTERGITTPQATFSACFGQCFFPLAAPIYADLLGDRLRQHPETRVYLINTGWLGGPVGVGQRIAIPHTRSMVQAAMKGDLDSVPFSPDPAFGLLVPDAVPHVPTELLQPRQLWSDPAAYDRQAKDLANRFVQNFRQFTGVDSAVLAAAPIG